jgi:Fanconi anemia group M protein
MKIIADIHEKDSLVIPELVERGIEVEIKNLKIGDYIVSNDIAIERKTINDFIASMMNKRLIKQLRELKSNYKKPLMIIESSDYHELYTSEWHPNMNKNAVRGMILSILLDFQIPIIMTKDYKETAEFIMLLVKKQEKPAQEISLKAKKHAFSVQEQQQLILESFPGIGPKTAKEILKKFKTLKNFSNASLEELKQIPKLGKKADFIKLILETSYKL